jgi:hypothetical protein
MCSNQNCGTGKGPTHRPVELNRDLRNKPLHIWKLLFFLPSQEPTMGKEQSFPQMVLGKLNIHMQKNEIGPLPYTTSSKIGSKT